MVQYAIKSIRTLQRWVNPEDISVFYTPPYDDDDKRSLEALGVDLQIRQPISEAFAVNYSMSERHYGEKCQIGTINEPTAVFLDCDTLVLGDIWPVLDGEYDFKARPGTASENDDDWRNLFDRFDRPLLPWMPNAGFLVFKNGIHKELWEEWLRYTNTDLGFNKDGFNHKEQYALALAVSEYNCVQMTPEDHVMEWNDEVTPHGVVYHTGTPNVEIPESFFGKIWFGLKKLGEDLRI